MHKLILENGMICNGNIIVVPLRRDILKGVHDDVHYGIKETQKRLKLQVCWPGYSRDVEEYIKRCLKKKNHLWPKEVQP